MKKYLPIFIFLSVLLFPATSFALPYFQNTESLLPGINDVYNLGTSSPSLLEYKNLFVKNVTISGTCTGCGGGGTVSTSTHEIANDLPIWTSTSGTPATLGQIVASTNGFILALSGGVPTWVASSSINNGVTSVTGTYPVQSSGGNTPAISLAFGTTTSNTWAGTQTFTNPTSESTQGSVTAPSYGIPTNGAVAGIYVPANNTLSFTNGISGLSWNGSAFYPNTNLARDLGIVGANAWNNLFVGTASTTALTISGTPNSLLYTGTTGVVAGVSTSTLSASSPLTGSFTQIGSGGSLGCQTASGSQAGCLSSTDWTTFNNKGSGSVTSVATGEGLSGGTITTSGTLVNPFVIATTTGLSISQIPYFTKTSGETTISGVGTSTLSASSPLTGSFTQVGSGGSIGCQTASGSQAGCLSSTDWTTFNNKDSNAYPFTPFAWGVSSSTVFGFTKGIITNASSTFNGGSVFDNSSTTNATTTSFEVAQLASTTNLRVSSLGQIVFTQAVVCADVTGLLLFGGAGCPVSEAGVWQGTAISTTKGGLGGNFGLSTGALSINSGTVTAGTLSIGNGGTGTTTVPVSQLLYGGATAYQSVATSSPTFNGGLTTSGTAGAWVGGSAYTVSIANNGVTVGMLAQAGANTVLGNPTGATANVQAFATSSLFTGTAGQVPYFASSGGLVGTSTIFINTAGDVGVGTTTPNALLTTGNATLVNNADAAFQLGSVGTIITGSAQNGQAVIRARPTFIVTAPTNVAGLDMVPTFVTNANMTNVRGAVIGGFFQPSTGTTITTADAIDYVDVYAPAAGAITNGRVVDISSPLVQGTVVPVNQYGLEVNNEGVAGITNTYGIFIDSQSGSTYNFPFIVQSGNSGFGTTTPTAALVSVAASTTAQTVENGYQGQVSIIAGLENTVTKLFQEIDQWGHVITSGDTPTVSGGTSTIAGNDRNGTISAAGVALTSVTVTFAHPYPTAPDCVESDNSTALTADISSISATGFTVSFSVGVASLSIWYQCAGHQ
jgi:hypothetical protein